MRIDLINEAIILATAKHSGQVRKGTDIPYIVHPMEVMAILSRMGADEDLLIAGVLHDVVEDTNVSVEDIQIKFGDKVAELVGAHSEDKSLSWEERKRLSNEHLKNETFEVKCLILADKLSNIRSMANDLERIGEKLWERFNAPYEKQRWYYMGSVEALESMQADERTKGAYAEFVELCRKVFGS